MPANPSHHARRRFRVARWSRLATGVVTAIALMLPPALLAGTAHGSPVVLAADTRTESGIRYSFDPSDPGAGATVTGDDGTLGTDLTIPNTVTFDDTLYEVTAIDTLAFAESLLETVTIGNSVVTIGNSAFLDSQLTEVTIGDSVTSIDAWAFANNQLGTVTIGDSVTTIGTSAFRSNLLDTVTIGNSVTTIGSYAFTDNQLTEITLGNSVTSIGGDAFYGSQLKTVTIPDSVTTIGNWAFGINELETVTIPDSVPVIGDYAFYGNQLTEITFGDSVITIGDYAFGHNQLNTVTIPNPVTTISAGAFVGNPLDTVTFANSVTTIGDYAFFGTQLTTVTIPNSVTTVGNYAFLGNLLNSVAIQGAGPATVTDKGPTGSFGDGDVTIRPECAFAASFGPSWHGYTVEPTATVSFDPGGHGAAVDPLSTVCGTAVTAPTPPTEADWVFTGWHTDPAATTAFDFDTVINADTTLYAGWGQSPTLTGNDTARFTVGTPASWEPDTLTGTPAATVSADALPDGLTLDEDTGVITGTPTATGVTVVTLTARNGVGNDATLELAITINASPTLTGDDSLTLTVGKTATWEPDTFTGHPSPTVTADLLPDGLTLDKDAGVITGTPTTAGTTLVTLTADNGVGDSATLELTITVETGITSFSLSTNKNSYTPAEAITITGAGLPTGTTVQISRHSIPASLGTTTVDTTGHFTLEATLPANTSVGQHEIVATAAVDGQTLTTSTPITIIAATPPGTDTTTDPTITITDTDALAPTGANSGLGLLLLTGILFLGLGTVLTRRHTSPQR